MANLQSYSDVSPGGAGSVSADLDRAPLTRFHVAVVAILSLGFFFDSMQLAMTNVIGTVLGHTGSGVHQGDLRMILAALFIGGALGGPLGGRIGDRIGRAVTLRATALGFGLSSLLTAAAVEPQALAAARFCSGIMLAAYLPLMWSYMAEISPPAFRGRLIVISGIIASLAGFATPMLTRVLDAAPLFGLSGWRATLVLSGVGGSLTAALLMLVPESPRWLERVGRTDRARAASNRFVQSTPVLASRETERPLGATRQEIIYRHSFGGRLALLMILQLIQQIAFVGFYALSGLVLEHKGFSTREALLFVGLTALGSPVGHVIGVAFIDKIPRHAMLIACYVLLAIFGLAFGYSQLPLIVVASGAGYFLVGAMMVTTLAIYGPPNSGASRAASATRQTG